MTTATLTADERQRLTSRLQWLGTRMTADALIEVLAIAEAMPQRTDLKAPFEAEALPCSTP
jgi:uncharacterized membrane protein YgcG